MNKHKRFRWAVGLVALSLPQMALASGDLEQQIAQTSMSVVIWASLILLGLIVVTSLSGKRSNTIFGLIILTVILPTVYLIGSTIYLNQVANSKGPVHWHADFEVWACGQEVELKDPVGRLSNKIGTSTLHEHNDKRIHLEGVVVNPGDASLSKFFRVVGGEITSHSLTIPTNDGPRNLISGQTCNGTPAELQVFAIKTNSDKYYTQEKVADPANYLISPAGQIPPGDCIIIELDAPKAKTDKLCRSYQAAMITGKRLKGPAQ